MNDEARAAPRSGHANPDGVDHDDVIAGGSYDVIRRRLLASGDMLEERTSILNEARLAEFGTSDMAVLARARVRTENNSIGRDIVQVGDLLLFGYNVFIGLKSETRVEDVLSLHRLIAEGDEQRVESVPIADSFLDN